MWLAGLYTLIRSGVVWLAGRLASGRIATTVLGLGVLKGLFYSFLVTVLPIILVGVWWKMKLYIVEFANETIIPYIMQNLSHGQIIIEVSGVAAWMGEKLHVVESVAIIISGLIMGFIISFFKK
jgi:hypothetical protein